MIFMTKSILALILVVLGVLNMIVILEALGRTDQKRFNPKVLRHVHRIIGFLMVALLICLTFLGVKILRAMGGELQARAALHVLISAATLFLLGMKIFIVRFYKKFYQTAIPMGLGVLMLIFSTTAISAGYFLALRGTGPPKMYQKGGEELVKAGADIFSQRGCADCHYGDREEKKMGPGLKGLFKGGKVLASGDPVTEESVLNQLVKPSGMMPPYKDFSDRELEALLAFLKSL
jgi:mono/diheme cytochrome c family protein